MVDNRTNDPLSDGNKGITRRKFILSIILVAIAGAFGSILSLLKVLSPSKKGAGYVSTIVSGDKLLYASGNQVGSVIKASAMEVGDAVLAYPIGKTSNPANLVQLIKLKEKDFQPPTDIKFTDNGFVAYSAICTHLGCTVSWVKNKNAPTHSYSECFCHNSIFNPEKGAKVIGGPAPVPLAQIGIRVDSDDSLVFTSGFNGPIGPQV